MPTLLSPLFLVLTLALFHLVGPPPADLGVHAGSLSACPGSAHCARLERRVSDPRAALASLRTALLAMPRSELVEESGTYLHATVSSALFGFVDDVELYADLPAGRLQARSISRLGDSDLGVNARRLAALEAALPT